MFKLDNKLAMILKDMKIEYYASHSLQMAKALYREGKINLLGFGVYRQKGKLELNLKDTPVRYQAFASLLMVKKLPQEVMIVR